MDSTERKPPPAHDAWLETIHGHAVDLIDPDPATITIEDIAWSLSRICRFNGHTVMHYSVAQHSVLASTLCGEDPLAALLHDMAEAYVGDLTRPMKIVTPDFALVEERILRACCASLAIERKRLDADCVKRSDREMLIWERRDVVDADHRWGGVADLDPHDRFPIVGWEAEEAYEYFLGRYRRLRGAEGGV